MATKTKKTAKTEPKDKTTETAKAKPAKKPRINRWKNQPETAAAPETTTTTEEAAPAKKPQTKAKTEKPEGKLSCLDAAVKVLGESKEPMTTKEMIEAMASKKYWTSPGGKTPAATLYSAILREMNGKVKDARFTKTERGKFGLNGVATHVAKPAAKPAKTKTAKSAGREPGPKSVSNLFKI